MKKTYIICPLIVLVLVVGFLFFKDMVKKNIIVLKNGNTISADETWKVGEKLFYRNSHRIAFVTGEEVESIQLKYHLTRENRNPSAFLANLAPRGIDYISWMKTVGTATIGAFFCIGLYFLSRRIVRTHKTKRNVDTNARNSEVEAEYSGPEAVVAFFLNIFKCQIGLKGETAARLKPVETLSPEGRWIYELRLKNGDEWDTRRMTLGTLAENSSNRSAVYDIIYDDRLVVKIPSTPITDFHQYANLIAIQRTIAEKLSPKECLVPGLSVILEKVQPFLDESDLLPETLEEKYRQLLESNPEYRNYLKVGNTFAYFMDFSKYFFLSHIIGEIHDPSARISKSVAENPNIIWDPVEFEAKYGLENVQIYDRLQPVYASFETSVRAVLQRNHVAFSIQEFQLKNWFLRCLSGEELAAPNLDVNAGTADELNALAAKYFLAPEGPVEAYRMMIKTHLTHRNLNRHKSQIAGIITNVLDLLAWLRIKKVAIRDLKPDNLLVAGDPARFPLFLESASQYSIGLIDVETAVSYGISADQRLDQPELAGTPSYATPSHLFMNEIIADAFENLPMTLCLQDWYATVAIIYRVVTGRRLFEQAAGVLVELQSEIPKAFEKNREPAIIFEEANGKYWKIAVAEFEVKIQEKKSTLKYISLIVSKDSRKMLLGAISTAEKRLTTSVKNIIQSQNVFTGDKLKKGLLSASFAKINRLKAEFKSNEVNPNFQPEEKKQAFLVLEHLEHLKRQSAHLRSVTERLNKSVPQISSYDLLKVMFNIVRIHMYEEPWETIDRGGIS